MQESSIGIQGHSDIDHAHSLSVLQMLFQNFIENIDARLCDQLLAIEKKLTDPRPGAPYVVLGVVPGKDSVPDKSPEALTLKDEISVIVTDNEIARIDEVDRDRHWNVKCILAVPLKRFDITILYCTKPKSRATITEI